MEGIRGGFWSVLVWGPTWKEPGSKCGEPAPSFQGQRSNVAAFFQKPSSRLYVALISLKAWRNPCV
jgi:hypothetical protein